MARQTLLGPLLDLNIAGLLTSVLSMVMPSEVSGALSDNLDQLFSNLPLDLSMIGRLASLDVLKGLGRKKRNVNPWNGKTVEQNQPNKIENNKYPESSPLLQSSLHGLTEIEVWNVLFFNEYDSKLFSKGSENYQTYALKTTERKRRSNVEGKLTNLVYVSLVIDPNSVDTIYHIKV